MFLTGKNTGQHIIEILGKDLHPNERVKFNKSLSCKNGWWVQVIHQEGYAKTTWVESNIHIQLLKTSANGNLIVRYKHDTKSGFLIKNSRHGDSYYEFNQIKSNETESLGKNDN